MPRLVLSLLCLCMINAASAAPAAWYLWRSKANAQQFCSQVPPGEGWLQIGGPYKDPQCKKQGKPGS
jgi:hypothetical protein